MIESTQEDILPQIRKAFYAMRNGMIADTLRKGGLKQKYIFGLQLPQIKEIAERYRPAEEEESATLAQALWQDRECREARLSACYLMPPSTMGKDEATEWAEDVCSREEADILAFRLLRYLPFAEEIAKGLFASEDSLRKYTAEAIRRFL